MFDTQSNLQPLGPASIDCKLTHTQGQLTFEQRVDDRIESLLARVEGVRRGSDLGRPTTFDDAGAAHAAAVARRDQENN